jgi:dTDP-4-amino-4,6-dideoxygalactose transaminase
MVGSDYAVAVNSGTSALHSALEAIGVTNGEVVIPALCPAMVAFAVIHAGARPVYADVDKDSQLVTDATIQKVTGSRTRAVIAVALHGLPCDIDRINKLCRPLGIVTIEDCAQALLARYKDVHAGTKADIGCFSFEKKKHITTGSEGGAVLTSNKDIAKAVRKFSGLGYKHYEAEASQTRVPEIHPEYQRFDTIGLNYRMSEAQAEIGLVALKTAQDKIWLRQEIGYLWQNAFGCQCQPHDYDAENSFYSAAFVNPIKEAWQARYNEFIGAGGDGFYAMPQLPENEPALKDFRGLLGTPVAANLQQRLMLFKTHYKTLEEAKWQCDRWQDCRVAA